MRDMHKRKKPFPMSKHLQNKEPLIGLSEKKQIGYPLGTTHFARLHSNRIIYSDCSGKECIET